MTPWHLCLCLLGCVAAQAGAQPVLSPHGYGQVIFGAPLAAAESRIGKARAPGYAFPGCAYVRFAQYPGVRFMVEDGIVTRADADGALANSSGIGLGTTLDRIRQKHPQARIEPHKYDADGHYVILPSADGHAALVFETSGGVVTTFRGGLEPSVEYVEGCL